MIRAGTMLALVIAAWGGPVSLQAAQDIYVPLLPFIRQGDAVPEPLGGLIGDPDRGKAIVLDRANANCLICHAVPVEGQVFMGELGPPLAGVGDRLTVGQIRLRMIDQSLINPDTIMPPYYRVQGLQDVAPEFAGRPALGAQEIEDVVAWLVTLKD